MALTKIGKEGITGISNASDATFLTATSGEGVTLAGTLAVTGVHTVGTNAVATSDGGAVTTSIVQGLAKAWADIDMKNDAGAASNDNSFNIASFTDVGTGAFNLVILSDMANADYCFSVGFNNQSSDASAFLKMNGSRATGQINMLKKENNSAVDCDTNCTTIHGDLA